MKSIYIIKLCKMFPFNLIDLYGDSLRQGFKNKKIVEFSTRVGGGRGSAMGHFSTKKK